MFAKLFGKMWLPFSAVLVALGTLYMARREGISMGAAKERTAIIAKERLIKEKVERTRDAKIKIEAANKLRERDELMSRVRTKPNRD